MNTSRVGRRPERGGSDRRTGRWRRRPPKPEERTPLDRRQNDPPLERPARQPATRRSMLWKSAAFGSSSPAAATSASRAAAARWWAGTSCRFPPFSWSRSHPRLPPHPQHRAHPREAVEHD